MNIYEKMLEAQTKLGVVAKNLSVSTGGERSYKAVGERDVIDAVKPVEKEFGIYSFPLSREIVESEQLESEGYGGKKKTTFYLKLRTTFRFVNVEKPEEFIDMVSYATGLDSGDKADGKAMTYADKYALLKAYKISTGDDPDQEGSKEEDYTPVKKMLRAEDMPLDKDKMDALKLAMKNKNVTEEVMCRTYKVTCLEEFTFGQWQHAMKKLQAMKGKVE